MRQDLGDEGQVSSETPTAKDKELRSDVYGLKNSDHASSAPRRRSQERTSPSRYGHEAAARRFSSDQLFRQSALAEIEDETTRRLLPLLLPPPQKLSDGTEDPLWGMSSDPYSKGWDPELEARLARFHKLKSEGVHFNESLMSNRSYNNPHIYSHLVEFINVDETRSNFPDLVGSNAWNPHDPDVLRDGDPFRITKMQEMEDDEREARQKRAKKRSIGFVSSTASSSTSTNRHDAATEKFSGLHDSGKRRKDSDSRTR